MAVSVTNRTMDGRGDNTVGRVLVLSPEEDAALAALLYEGAGKNFAGLGLALNDRETLVFLQRQISSGTL